MRTFRNRTAVLTAATAAMLSLALTACNGEDSKDTKSASPAASAPAESGGQDQGTDKGQGSTEQSGGQQQSTSGGQSGEQSQGGGSNSSAGGSSQGGSDQAQTPSKSGGSDQATTSGGKGSSSKSPAPCQARQLTVSAATVDGPPYTHLTLTAKNHTSSPCLMVGFPKIHFLDNARGIVPAVAKSKPAGQVVVEPGGSAYAAVRLSEGGRKENTEAVKEFTVTLEGGAGMASVTAPGAEGIAVDPAKWATGYWTPELRNGADEF
ncbi:DUF4232 domain-containing protein [Streptomyces sp. 796.1]|uniref:DUF4232 domain-containing protein n=1 Tax=Streptomyces sp. 796.1 TaxID=3163029 RepID=UPI0039C9369C